MSTPKEDKLLYHEIYFIVKKPPKDRTLEDINKLMKMPISFLISSNNPLAALYARYLEYKEFKKEKQIFESKKRGVYCVIEGTLGVMNKRKEIARAYKNLEHLFQSELIQSIDEFEELVALEDTKVAFISHKIFAEIIEPMQNEKQWQLIDNLVCTPLFSNLTFQQVRKLSTYFSSITLGRHAYLFQESQPSTNIFFINKGIFEIRKVFSGEINYEEKVKREGIIAKDFSISKIQKLQAKEFKIKVLQVGDYVGEEDALKDKPYEYSVMCSSLQGEVSVISSKDFIEQIYSQPSIKESIHSNMNRKLVGFNKRKEEISGSLENYGKYLVNEKFHKDFDEVVAEIAINPNIMAATQTQKDEVLNNLRAISGNKQNSGSLLSTRHIRGSGDDSTKSRNFSTSIMRRMNTQLSFSEAETPLSANKEMRNSFTSLSASSRYQPNCLISLKVNDNSAFKPTSFQSDSKHRQHTKSDKHFKMRSHTTEHTKQFQVAKPSSSNFIGDIALEYQKESSSQSNLLRPLHSQSLACSIIENKPLQDNLILETNDLLQNTKDTFEHRYNHLVDQCQNFFIYSSQNNSNSKQYYSRDSVNILSRKINNSQGEKKEKVSAKFINLFSRKQTTNTDGQDSSMKQMQSQRSETETKQSENSSFGNERIGTMTLKNTKQWTLFDDKDSQINNENIPFLSTNYTDTHTSNFPSTPTLDEEIETKQKSLFKPQMLFSARDYNKNRPHFNQEQSYHKTPLSESNVMNRPQTVRENNKNNEITPQKQNNFSKNRIYSNQNNPIKTMATQPPSFISPETHLQKLLSKREQQFQLKASPQIQVKQQSRQNNPSVFCTPQQMNLNNQYKYSKQNQQLDTEILTRLSQSKIRTTSVSSSRKVKSSIPSHLAFFDIGLNALGSSLKEQAKISRQ